MGRKYQTTLNDYMRWLKSGKGLGVGKDYRPWLRVNDVSSHGKSVKIHGIKTGRTHQLLSKLEYFLFLITEFNPLVIDIREQFPLFPLDLVIRLAHEAEIDYPIIDSTNTPVVLTTDFLLTLKVNGAVRYIAIAVKESDELKDPDVLNRLEIERLWWEMLGIQWLLVTEKQLDEVVANNIAWMADPVRKNFISNTDQESFVDLAAKIKPGIYEWGGLVRQLVDGSKYSPARMSELLRASIWYGFLDVNFTTPIQKQNLIQINSVSIESNVRCHHDRNFA